MTLTRKALSGAAVLLVLGLSFGGASAQDVKAGKAKSEICESCHGPGGNSMGGNFPSLAANPAAYLEQQLQDFKAGKRPEPLMEPFVSSLSAQDMKDIAAYFEAQPAKPSGHKPDEVRASRGKVKAAENLCTACHMPELTGMGNIPRLAGQQFDYLVKQLKDFKAKRRVNDGGNMASVVANLSDDDIIDLSHYMSAPH